MSSSRSRPIDDLRLCGDHFHLKISQWRQLELPPGWRNNQVQRLPESLVSQWHGQGTWPTGTSNQYVRGAHTSDYTPFVVAKALQGPFCVLRRIGSDMGDFHCRDWKDGGRVQQMRYENLAKNPLDTSWKYREGDWKLYLLEDISERPFLSDLKGNDGLREDFARRQSERWSENEDGRGPPPADRVEEPLLGTSLSSGGEETLAPGITRSAAYAPFERWGDSRETLV